jgi:hypothetical protein
MQDCTMSQKLAQEDQPGREVFKQIRPKSKGGKEKLEKKKGIQAITNLKYYQKKEEN